MVPTFRIPLGVAYVMHAADLEHQTAISACKRCRPVVDPIGREQLVIYGDLLIYPLVMTNIAMVAPWP